MSDEAIVDFEWRIRGGPMGFSAVSLHRASQYCGERRLLSPLARVLWGLQVPLFGASIPPTAIIGPGTQVGYRGIGVVVHGRSRVGRDCIISQQVTIGGRSGLHGVPIIGDRVLIGAGARILGPVTIHDDAKIGANAVVLVDVPAGATAVGVPARVL